MASLGLDGIAGPDLRPINVLAEWAVSTRAFRRNRVPVVKKVVAAALCNSGYSYRDVARMMGEMSYVAARDAFFSLQTSLPPVEKRHRRIVAIDGSDISFGGKEYHVWLARDVDSGDIMAFQASPDASALDGTKFLSAVAAQCDNRPTVRLGYGQNRPRGLVNLDLYFEGLNPESIMERLGRFFRGVGA
jgi:putative transposase